MRDAHAAITSLGGQVLGVGMGTPAMAAGAKQAEHLPFRLVIDLKLDLYRALEARRGSALTMLRPEVFLGAFRALRRGHRQSGVQADPMQLGATALVDRAGRVRACHVSAHPADHPSIDWILSELRRATGP